jgi:hypothetical protein
MNEKEERIYIDGERAAWRMMLGECLRHLEPSEEKSRAQLVIELDEARVQLRHLCEEFGDNDFEDDLHLGDAIEKHLGKHLYEWQRYDDNES